LRRGKKLISILKSACEAFQMALPYCLLKEWVEEKKSASKMVDKPFPIRAC
jgi:hypothetical protein